MTIAAIALHTVNYTDAKGKIAVARKGETFGIPSDQFKILEGLKAVRRAPADATEKVDALPAGIVNEAQAGEQSTPQPAEAKSKK